MSNYYDETLEEIKRLISKGDLEEAKFEIKKELSMPYIPPEFESELHRLSSDILFSASDKKEEKEVHLNTLLDQLKMDSRHQLMAVNGLVDRNLRSILPELQDYLSNDPFPEAASLLIDAMAEQEINEEFTLVKDGIEYTFWADAVIPVAKSIGFLKALKLLEERLAKEPAMLEMAKAVLIHDAYMLLPLSIEEDEADAYADSSIDEVNQLMNPKQDYAKN